MPPTKRDYGTGSVSQRPNGTWEARAYLDGHRRAVSGKTRADALRKLDALKRTATAKAQPAQQRLGDYLSEWLDSRRDQLKPSTHQRYVQFARQITDALGTVTLGDLRAADLRVFYRELSRTYAAYTVLHIHRLLHHALAEAVREETLGRNVAELVQAPRVERREQPSLTTAQAKAFIEAARSDRFYVLWLLAISTGMRRGELLGLRWDAVDFRQGTITIRNAATMLIDGWYEGPPKTIAGLRQFPLPAFLLDALKEQRRRIPTGNIVFPNTAGNLMQPNNLLRRHWRPLLERAGLPSMHPHALRHSATSLLLAAGVPPHIVQRIVGHADSRVTMAVYAHVHQADMGAGLAKLGETFGDVTDAHGRTGT